VLLLTLFRLQKIKHCFVISRIDLARDYWLAVAFCLWEEGSGSPGKNGGGRTTGGRRWKVLKEWEAEGIE